MSLNFFEEKKSLAVSMSLNSTNTSLCQLGLPSLTIEIYLSLDIFLQQSKEFQNDVINQDKPILVVECSHPNSWYRILNRDDKVIGVEGFGESAPGSELLEHFGFNKANVVNTAKSLLND